MSCQNQNITNQPQLKGNLAKKFQQFHPFNLHFSRNKYYLKRSCQCCCQQEKGSPLRLALSPLKSSIFTSEIFN